MDRTMRMEEVVSDAGPGTEDFQVLFDVGPLIPGTHRMDRTMGMSPLSRGFPSIICMMSVH